ncbi:unnamed protein product [Ixodes hexagonus]
MIPHSSRDTNPTVTAAMDEDPDMDIYEDLHDRDPSSVIGPKLEFADLEDSPELDLLDTSVIPRLKTPQKKQRERTRPLAAESVKTGMSALLSATTSTAATATTTTTTENASSETLVTVPAKPQSSSTSSDPADGTAWAALKRENTTLKHNISVLYQTAKLLMQSKDKEIAYLKQKFDNLIFRRNQGGMDRTNGFREPPPPPPRHNLEKAPPRQLPQAYTQPPMAKQASEKPKADLSEDLQRLYKYRKVKSPDRTEFSKVEPLDVSVREPRLEEEHSPLTKRVPKDVVAKGPRVPIGRLPITNVRRRPSQVVINRMRPACHPKVAAASYREHKRERPVSTERRRYPAEPLAALSPGENRWSSPVGRREDTESPHAKRYRGPRSRSRSRSRSPPHDGRRHPSHGHRSRHHHRSRREVPGAVSPDYKEYDGVQSSRRPLTPPPHCSNDFSPPRTSMPYAGRRRSRYSRSPQHSLPLPDSPVKRAGDFPAVQRDDRNRIRKSHANSCLPRTSDGGSSPLATMSKKAMLRKSPRKAVGTSAVKKTSRVPKTCAVSSKEVRASNKTERVAETGGSSIPVLL